MDEELGVKAPVTRLRRRLSTEAEGAQSPSTPSTPNKKRATRLAKPALELIDENVPESKPKKITRRASTLDTTTDAPADEKPATPSRRSTRIRSNTSLLLEVTQSIVADSPRAKRALRRNSQAGSDTESVTTPARRTRARKDSTSSIEKLAVTSSNEKVTTQVVEAISEEPEKDISKDKLNITQDTTPLRKSPRLSKKGKKNEKAQKDDNELPDQNIDEVETSLNGLPTTDKTTSNTHDKSNRKSKDFKNQNLSLNSAKLINDLPTTPKIPNELNKSVSSIEQLKNEKSIRKRTKSWTTLTNNDMTPQNNDNTIKFASGDSVIEKLNVKSPAKIINKSLTSTENEENISSQKSVDERNNNSNDTIKMLEITPTKNIKSVVIIEDNDSNSENAKLEDQHNYDESVKNDKEDQCVPVINTSKRLTSESFSIEPMDIDETIPDNVTINFSRESISGKNESVLKQDSDQLNHFSSGLNKSSNKSTRKSSISLQQESNASPRKFSSSVSEESKFKGFPVDKSLESETLHNKSLITMLDDDNDSLVTEKTSKSSRKSSLSKSISDNSIRKSLSSQGEEEQMNDISNKSKRKSVSVTETSSTEKTSDENKSTLVLSHLKDVSRNEITNVSPNNINNDSPKLINIANKEKDKINQSNYSTSTPLQQKSLQKLAMQINTSSITPHVEIKNTSKANKSKTPVKNKSNDSHDSNSSEESDEDSSKQSKIIDNEAKEASDDYESGDSRDSEDVQYEKDHEITEKGETLESEPYSDESDYEKDSFVVTSDEEDGDLLSGSGDDLSLSDNELKMTAKSKKKFDERKRKEQKKASREMYEARHQLDKSDKPGKSQLTKKGKKLDSSASESEEEKTKPKKKNRLRIDSSQDITMNNSETNANITCNKKKTKRLSESVCENNANEKEITIHNQSIVESSDPLAAAIKKEPKTPQRDFNMSTVLINDNIEQVLVNTDMSMIKSKETSDPLQTTMQEDEESDSDISENMQIKENYDSVLQSLNKSNKQNKIISHDASLNLNKKPKNTVKPPIVDELNLTQTKSKKSKAQNTNEDIKHKASGKKDDGENSDSIDMRLLFPEDSNDSEKNSSKFKPEKNEEAEEFIPLKKTEAKTNLRENIEPEENTNVNFFIDTQGNFDMDISTEISANKKNKHKANTSSTSTDKKNRISDVSHAGQEPILSLLEVSSKYEHSQSAHESSPNVSMGSNKKKRKKNKSLLDDSQAAEISETTEEPPSNISQNNDKKKNMSQLHVSQHDDEAAHESSTNVSMGSNKKKRKKNKSLLDDSQTAVMNSETTEETPSNISQNNDKKKNMSQLHVSQQEDEVAVAEEVLLNVSVKSEKKKKKNESQLDTSQIVENAAPSETVNDSLNSGKKKKKNKSHLDISQIVENSAPQETEVNVSLNSEKKKKKKNKSQLDMSENLDDAVPEETIINVSQNSNKKKKKKNKPSNNIPEKDDNTASGEKNNISQKKEKKNKSLDVSQNIDNTGEESDDAPMEITYKSEKTSENPVPVEDDGALNKSKNKFKKKKKKTKKVQHETDDINIDEVKGMKRKHNEDSSNIALDNIQMANTHNKKKKFDESGNVIPGVSGSDKPNKRKADDDIQRNAKVFKDNIFKKIHIPRLPETVINQLVDQPASESKKPKKKKEFAISTVPFVVEEGPRRKNKPSNYLEQSIYLNDYKSPVKQKKKFANPKVLPFTPTVITSGEGYTSKFKINVLPQNTDFIAQTSSVANFRESRLAKQREKKIKVEQFKKQRKHMLAKF